MHGIRSKPGRQGNFAGNALLSAPPAAILDNGAHA